MVIFIIMCTPFAVFGFVSFALLIISFYCTSTAYHHSSPLSTGNILSRCEPNPRIDHVSSLFLSIEIAAELLIWHARRLRMTCRLVGTRGAESRSGKPVCIVYERHVPPQARSPHSRYGATTRPPFDLTTDK